MQLTEDDRARLSRLLLWIRNEWKFNNEKLGKYLNCSDSSISDWINKRRVKIHDDKIVLIGQFLKLPQAFVIKLITESSALPISIRIEQMRENLQAEGAEGGATETPDEQFDKVLGVIANLPVAMLPDVIAFASGRLKNVLSPEDPSISPPS